MTALRAALDALPKVGLHRHLEGTMRPRVSDLAGGAKGIPLPTTDPSELYSYESLDGFLDVLWLVQATLMARAGWGQAGLRGRCGQRRARGGPQRVLLHTGHALGCRDVLEGGARRGSTKASPRQSPRARRPAS